MVLLCSGHRYIHEIIPPEQFSKVITEEGGKKMYTRYSLLSFALGILSECIYVTQVSIGRKTTCVDRVILFLPTCGI